MQKEFLIETIQLAESVLDSLPKEWFRNIECDLDSLDKFGTNCIQIRQTLANRERYVNQSNLWYWGD